MVIQHPNRQSLRAAGDRLWRSVRSKLTPEPSAGGADESHDAGPAGGTGEVAAEHSLAYRMLASAPYGLTARDLAGTGQETPTREQAREVRERIVTLREKASLVEALERGESLEAAVAGYIRSYITGATVGSMRLMCEALASQPGTAMAGELGFALVAKFFGVPKKAWYHFGRIPDGLWRRLAPDAYFKTAREIGDDTVTAAVTKLLEDNPEDASAGCWFAAAEAAFAARRYELARHAQLRAVSAADRDPDALDLRRDRIDWLGEWLDRVERRTAVSPATGVAFGVLDYKTPDRPRTSANLDDYVQSLAVLGQLARHRTVDLTGPADLAEFVSSLRSRVGDPQALDGVQGPVTLVPVNRDASSLDELPDPTWLLAAGDFIEQWFGTIDFPLDPRIRPLFVSFHCHRPSMLTPEAVDYLRKYAPVGCRDWSTVYLLHAAGVPAFFSGCVTTTIDTIAADRRSAKPASGRPVAFVGGSTPGKRSGVHVTLVSDHVRSAPLVDNLTEARRLVDDYRNKYARVVTDDLHAYLVARSVGTPVKFAPDNPADLRFNGLLGIDDAAFDAIRAGINDKLASTLSLVLSGAGEEEVYAHWRTICAGDVEAAGRRISDITPMPPPSFDIAAACARIRAKQVEVGARDGDRSEVHVTVALDANLKGPLDVVLEALSTSCSRPLHVWVLCRDHGPADFERLGKLFPEVAFTWLPCDDVDYGQVKGMLRHTTAATMDRLLLPELLDGLERVVYIDIDMLPLADIAELADWDLDGAPFAASTTPFSPSGYTALVKVAGRQRAHPERGDYLLRWMSFTHTFDFPRFNAGVLVLDLAKMRDDDFCRRFIPWVDVYGLNDQVVLNIYAGSTHVALPPEWNHRPSHERIDEPKLIHWAGWVKPWSEPMAPLSARWRQYEAAFEARVAKLGQSPGQ